jgi:outer membrane murein-binding lipoprotein Lpp
MPNPTERLSLRLAPEHLKLLHDEAEALGSKPSVLASVLLVRALSDARTDELRAEVEQLRKELQRMSEDIANLGLVLLVKAGKEEPDKARAWIRKNFRP